MNAEAVVESAEVDFGNIIMYRECRRIFKECRASFREYKLTLWNTEAALAFGIQEQYAYLHFKSRITRITVK